MKLWITILLTTLTLLLNSSSLQAAKEDNGIVEKKEESMDMSAADSRLSNPGNNGETGNNKPLTEIPAYGFQQQSISIGLKYNQIFFNIIRDKDFDDGTPARVYLTNRGEVAPFILYNTPEYYFYELHLPKGNVFVGYNFAGQYSNFTADRELYDNPYETHDTSSKIKGDYLYMAPLLFVRIGPLFDSIPNSYWRCGLGYGLGIIRFHGQVYYRGTKRIEKEEFDYQSDQFDLAARGVWELQLGNWQILIEAHAIDGKTKTGKFHFGNGSVNVGYSLPF